MGDPVPAHARWPQERVDALLHTLQMHGWEWKPAMPHAHHFTKRGWADPRTGLDWVQLLVPFDTWGTDTPILCDLAARRLIEVEGQPMLHLGPLTAREAAYSDEADLLRAEVRDLRVQVSEGHNLLDELGYDWEADTGGGRA